MRWLTPVIPAVCESKAGGSQRQTFEISLANMVITLSLLKILNSVHARWQAPVVPGTREAKAVESLEPRRQRLQSQKKKKKKKRQSLKNNDQLHFMAIEM